MAKRYLTGHCRPSAYFRRITQHDGNVSEGTKHRELARRRLLNREVVFYSDGFHFIDVEITEQEQYESQILRFAHASILIGQPVGDKASCYVDATKNPIEVVIYNIPLEQFIAKSAKLIKSGQLDEDLLLGEPVKTVTELKNERDVKLFGR